MAQSVHDSLHAINNDLPSELARTHLASMGQPQTDLSLAIRNLKGATPTESFPIRPSEPPLLIPQTLVIPPTQMRPRTRGERDLRILF